MGGASLAGKDEDWAKLAKNPRKVTVSAGKRQPASQPAAHGLACPCLATTCQSDQHPTRLAVRRLCAAMCRVAARRKLVGGAHDPQRSADAEEAGQGAPVFCLWFFCFSQARDNSLYCGSTELTAEPWCIAVVERAHRPQGERLLEELHRQEGEDSSR
jgi:hypothetical protein